MTPQSIQQALQQIVSLPEVHKRSILADIEKIIKRIGEDIMEQNKDMVGADHGCSLPIVPDISAITTLVYTKHDVEHQTVAEYLATGNHMLSGATALPAFDIVAAPHPDDKQYHIDNDENWIEPGTIINDCMLHELFHKETP